MAKNDTLLLDGILKRRASDSGSTDVGEIFELFALEQILKDYDLSRDDLESGWIDGRNDGGVDAFYIFCNGRLVRDAESFHWPRQGAELEIVVATCKHANTFSLAPVTSIHSTLTVLFDFSTAADSDGYSGDLLDARESLRQSYLAVASASPRVLVRIVYASRGDVPAPNVSSKAEEARAAAAEPFSNATARFEFLGASELVALFRRQPDFSLSLVAEELLPSATGNSYIATVNLGNFYKFISDDAGRLRRYLFDSNVRDFMGHNPVNSEIRATLAANGSSEFWWLNNGVTILATAAAMVGRQLRLSNVQIVNGLQTSESIYRHFSGGGLRPDNRSVLAKVLVTQDESVRDQIIKATNSQTAVELLALHATDKIQRDIEDVLEKHDWFFERRKNYYKFIGKPESRFVTPLFAGAAFLGIVLRDPARSSRLRSKNLRAPATYDLIFSEDVPLAVWPVIIAASKRAEEFLVTVRPSGALPRFLATWRNHVALLMVARHLGTFGYNSGNIAAIDPRVFTSEYASDAWKLIREARREFGAPAEREHTLARVVAIEVRLAVREWGVRAPEAVRALAIERPGKEVLTEEVLGRIDTRLPAQPWPSGIHATVARELEVDPRIVARAIKQLIATGRRYSQRNGVVDQPASEASQDASRARPADEG